MALSLLRFHRLSTTHFSSQFLRRVCTSSTTKTTTTTTSSEENNNEKHEGQSESTTSSTSLQERLCEATLLQVNQHGWTSLAIDAALKDLELSTASASLLPVGIATVSDYLDSKCNKHLARHLFQIQLEHLQQKEREQKIKAETVKKDQDQDQDEKYIKIEKETETEKEKEKEHEHTSKVEDEQCILDNLKTPPSRAAYAIQFRLSLLDPYHQFWYQAVALRPRLPRQSFRNRLLLADEIAAFANYNSPNMGWYTDRMVIATLYLAAELYWITDTSKNRKNTTDFIHTRLDNAHNVRTKLTSSFSSVMSLYDATTASASTLFRASRNSY